MTGTDPVLSAPSLQCGACGRGEDPTGITSLIPRLWGGFEVGCGMLRGWGAGARAGHGPCDGMQDAGWSCVSPGSVWRVLCLDNMRTVDFPSGGNRGFWERREME